MIDMDRRSMMSGSRSGIPPLRVERNSRYAGIRASVDSGNTLQKQMERNEEVRHFYKFKPDEIFRRIHVTSLVALLIEVEKLRIHEEDLAEMSDEEEQDQDSEDSAIEDGDEFSGRIVPMIHSRGAASTITNRSSSVIDLIQGIGEMDIMQASYDNLDSVSQVGRERIEDEKPFLLMDVRTEDEIERNGGKIIGAEIYPMAKLNLINFETKSMLRFKNRKDKLIIIYDHDESRASRCATTLVERGYDNVFMLSGGVKVAQIKFPNIPLTLNSGHLTAEEIDSLEDRLIQLSSKENKKKKKLISASQPNLNVTSSSRGTTSSSRLSYLK